MIFAGSRFSNHVACENRESYGGGGGFHLENNYERYRLGSFGPIYHLACRNKSRALPRMGRGGAMLKKVASATAGGRRGLPVGRQSRLLSLWGHWGQCHLGKKTLNPNQRRQRGDTKRNPKPLNPKPCYHAGGGGGYVTSYKD